MALSNRKMVEVAMTEIPSYQCKISGATFTKRCTVSSCFANVDNLNKSGVDVEAVSGCAYVDFHLAGFPEELSYAVEEQGFVGYRDLEYLAPFLKTQTSRLRDIYIHNQNLFRRSVAILWAVKNNGTGAHCQTCGHPLKPGAIRCTSISMCEERRDVALEVIAPFLPVLTTPEDQLKAMNAVWKSLNEKHTPRIPLTDEEVEKLKDLRLAA
jgi:hypothetical protein